MKKLMTFLCLASFSLSSYAVKLVQISVIRSGGGQIEASVGNSDEGLEITLKKCNFRDVEDGVNAKVKGKEIVSQTLAILNGEAIIASDATPRAPGMASGSWQSMSYSYDTTQFPYMSARYIETKEVKAPIIILDGKVSNVLSELETQARALCKN